jgi:succinate dehydrogenase/fumarate reductase flavoprotein subunit
MAHEIDTDIVVIGGGGAGLAAAIESAALNCRVHLLEKESRLGGSTAWSVGSISAAGTTLQKRRGITDTADAHFEDLEVLASHYANRDNPGLRRILVDNIADTMDWLISLGLVFTGPMPEPMHRQPRMHNVLPNSTAFPYRLGRRARRLGVNIQLKTQATNLLSEGGRITGVLAVSPKRETIVYRARLGVILAGGDFSASQDLKTRFVGLDIARVPAVNPAATGEGIAIGLANGGVVLNGEVCRGPLLRFVPPPRADLLQRLPPFKFLAELMRYGFERLPPHQVRSLIMRFLTTAISPSSQLFREGAILVNRLGGRFTDEIEQPGLGVSEQNYGTAIVIFDGTVGDRFNAWPRYISAAPGIGYAYLDDYRRARGDIFHVAPTLEELAQKLRMAPAALVGTVNAYNTGHDYVPRSGHRMPIMRQPFYALGPVSSHIVFTDGGLAITERMEVVRNDGKPIPGLYAAGANGQGGMILGGRGHHLGWAFVSGRIAGRIAAGAAA